MADEVLFLCPHQSEHKVIDKSNVNTVKWENEVALQSDETTYFVDEAAALQFEDKIKQAQGIL